MYYSIITGWLRGYRTDQPEKFKALMKNSTVSAKVRELGIE